MVFRTGDNNYGCAKWIVDAVAGQGTHTTIAGALTSSASGDTIFIRPGTYTENLTLKAGVNLTAFGCDSSLNQTGHVIISGTCTMTTAGSVTISGIQLQTNSAALLAVTGSAASIVNLENCNLNCTNTTGITFSSSSASAAIDITDCTGNLGTTGIAYFAHSSAGNLNIFFSELVNTGLSTTANTISAGVCQINYSIFQSPITTSSTGSFSAGYTSLAMTTNTTALTIGGATTSSCIYSFISSGSASAISVSVAGFSCANCEITSSNTNAITGSGSVILSGAIFGVSTKSNVTTQTGGTIHGLTQGTAPSTGFLGERLTANASAVATTSTTAKTIASVSLTPGIWDVTGMTFSTATGGTALMQAVQMGISTTDNTLPGGGGGIGVFQNTFVATALSAVVPPTRATLSTTTTYYLVVTNFYSSTTCPTNGIITATRVG